MKLAVLFSGGKDSCLALHLAKKQGHEINCLLSIIPKNLDSFMFHKPDKKLLKKQAEMLNLPLITLESRGLENEELEDLKKLIEKVKGKVEGIAVGGIASNYQGSRVEKITQELGLKFYAPLWNLNSEALWNKLLEDKFKVIITKISSEGIPPEFLGKPLGKEEYEKLKKLSEKYKFRIDFEGGEAETSVLFMPEFKKPINLEYEIINEGKYRHYLKITKIT